MKQFSEVRRQELLESKLKDVLKKKGIVLKASILSIIAGMGGKELDYLVKAINAIRPLVEDKNEDIH